MKQYKFKAKIINLDGSEIDFFYKVNCTTKEEAEKMFYSQVRTENEDYLEIKDVEFLGMFV